MTVMRMTKRLYSFLSALQKMDRYALSSNVQRWLEEHLEPQWSVLEFGSGCSTLFLADRVRRVVSIETDPYWYEQTQNKITDYAHVELLRTRRSLHRDELFDLIVIDGGIRQRNLAHCIGLFREYLILDDVHVPKWNRLAQKVDVYFEEEATLWNIPAPNRWLHRKTKIWNQQAREPIDLSSFRDDVCPQWRMLEM